MICACILLETHKGLFLYIYQSLFSSFSIYYVLLWLGLHVVISQETGSRLSPFKYTNPIETFRLYTQVYTDTP